MPPELCDFLLLTTTERSQHVSAVKTNYIFINVPVTSLKQPAVFAVRLLLQTIQFGCFDSAMNTYVVTGVSTYSCLMMCV
jgi:hypothetical protein